MVKSYRRLQTENDLCLCVFGEYIPAQPQRQRLVGASQGLYTRATDMAAVPAGGKSHAYGRHT